MKAEITIDQGNLIGSIKNADTRPYYSFQGIPYAKPPVGPLRFKAPEPADKWTGTFEATKDGHPSVARNPIATHIIQGSEDCLTLNVFSKKLDANRPVMLWIHGGLFIFGSNSTKKYGPEYLLEKNVVVVSVNYRLGILGFFSLDDSSLGITGNAGLKDVVLALKWVQKNVTYFGGDPNNVTIFGQSAGAVICHCLLLSPYSEGLFHKVIAQSGTILNSWAISKNFAKEIKDILNIPHAHDAALLQVLNEKTAEELLEIQEKCYKAGFNAANTFAPVVDKNAEYPFLPDAPVNLIHSGKFHKMPFMLGYNSKEGMIVEINLMKMYFVAKELSLPYHLGYDSSRSKYLLEKIRQFYENAAPKNKKLFDYMITSDAMITSAIYETIHLQSKQSNYPIYLYRMSLESNLNLSKKFLKIKERGVPHGDELSYIFKDVHAPIVEADSLEDCAIQRFVKLWTNFAKYGNPTPLQDNYELNVVWTPVSTDNVYLLNIGDELSLYDANSNPDRNAVELWKTIIENCPNRTDIYKQTNMPNCN